MTEHGGLQSTLQAALCISPALTRLQPPASRPHRQSPLAAVAESMFVFISLLCAFPPAEKQTDCAYQEVKDVRVVSRGLGAWGDMVIELKNGDKLELRSLEK